MFKDNLKITFSIVIILLLLVPAIIGYALQLKIQAVSFLAISVYGLYSLAFLILQIIFTEINNYNMKNDVKNRPDNWNDLGVGVLVVGYKEEKHLLKECLLSIKNNNYKNIKKTIFVIDGNEESDMYMVDIYKEVFNNNIIKLNKNLSEYSENDIDYSIFEGNNICILQPHGGKREGLYNGFKIFMNDQNIKVVVTTDSDTILEENAILELTYQCRHDNIGAVAGQIEIWNTSESLLSHIVSYRYWMSFNLERGSESYWKTVLCVAGPMACYKTDVLKNILEEWYNQRFLGQRCTFGDDRHLTNRVLKYGKKVVYTPFALGYTDTPSNWEKYLKQQTRWGKSYFREFLYNMQSVHLHSLWMCYELCYHIVYFFLLMYWTIYILYFCSIYQQALAIIVTLCMGIIRSLYGIIKTKNFMFIFFYLYTFIYSFIIIPSKITALVTLWDMKWGTRGKTSGWISTFWSTLLWFSILIGGFIYTIHKNKEYLLDTNDNYKFAFLGFIIYISFIILTVFVEFILRKTNKISNDVEKKIVLYKNIQSSI